MSVNVDSSSPLGPDSWNYFEHQTVNWRYTIGSGQTSQDDPGNLGSRDFNPAGGLERGEVAELVWMKTVVNLRVEPPDSQTTIELIPLGVQFDFEWQKDITARFSQVYAPQSVNTGNTANELSVVFEASESNTDFSLQFGQTTAMSPYLDQADSVSGGGDGTDHGEWQTYFRRDFGRGPFFHYDEPIKLDAAYSLNGNSKEESTIDAAAQTTMVWDIFELEQTELEDLRPVDR